MLCSTRESLVVAVSSSTSSARRDCSGGCSRLGWSYEETAVCFLLTGICSSIVGMSSETAVLALNYGDGLSNYIYPHSSSLMAFLAACGVGYGTWMKFMGKLFGLWFAFASLFMMLAVVVGYH